MCSSVKQHGLITCRNKPLEYVRLKNGYSPQSDAILAGNARSETLSSVWLNTPYFRLFVGIPFEYFGEHLNKSMIGTFFEDDLTKGKKIRDVKLEYDENRGVVWLPNITGRDLILAILLENRPHDIRNAENFTKSLRIVTRESESLLERNIHNRFPVVGNKEFLTTYVKRKIAA